MNIKKPVQLKFRYRIALYYNSPFSLLITCTLAEIFRTQPPWSWPWINS